MKNQKNVEEYRSTNVDKSMFCDFCEFMNKKELMLHKKSEYVDNVSDCWDFISGICQCHKR